MTLHEWRQSRDMTTRELATALGERPSFVSDIEHGRIPIGREDLILVRLAMLDGIRTEADFWQMISESKDYSEAHAPKGPGYAFIESKDGCSLVRTIDGKHLNKESNRG